MFLKEKNTQYSARSIEEVILSFLIRKWNRHTIYSRIIRTQQSEDHNDLHSCNKRQFEKNKKSASKSKSEVTATGGVKSKKGGSCGSCNKLTVGGSSKSRYAQLSKEIDDFLAKYNQIQLVNSSKADIICCS